MMSGSERLDMIAVSPERESEAGWTMVEMLVGLVLLSLITVLLTSSVNNSRRAIDQVQLRNGNVSVEVVGNYLRHALSEAQPIRPAAAAVDAPLIDARSRRLRLITSYAPAGQFGGLYVIDLDLAPNRGRAAYDLVETRTLYRPDPEPGMPEPVRPSSRTRLLPNVSGISFRYYGLRADQEAPDWSDGWSDPTALPQLIEIRVAFPAGDDRRWLPLNVALPVGR
jgi:general secretion pathway protein J